MIDIYSGEIKDIIPVNLMGPEVEAISYSVGQALRKMQEFAMSSSLYVEIGKVPERTLDLMALELNTQYYEQSLPRKTKEALIQQTISWYMHAGTIPVLEEFLKTVLDGGVITEWFRYGGKPYHFKALVEVGEHEIPLGYSRKIRQQINVYKNLRSWLEALIFRYSTEYQVSTKYDNRLRIRTEFYPRYNLAHHYLEDAHCLDGGKALNGYAVDKVLDFYPTKLTVSNNTVQETHVLPGLEITSGLRIETADNCKVRISAAVIQKLLNQERLRITGGGGVGAAVGVRVACKTGANVRCTIGTRKRIRIETLNAVSGAVKTVYVVECLASVQTAGEITVKKNLRYLVGSGTLDGSNILNADIYKYVF